jgi:hypothetical protein
MFYDPLLATGLYFLYQSKLNICHYEEQRLQGAAAWEGLKGSFAAFGLQG